MYKILRFGKPFLAFTAAVKSMKPNTNLVFMAGPTNFLSFVVTIFLDLFDRIHAYSSVFHQQIEFEEWADRWMQLQVESTVRDLVIHVEEELNKHNQARF
ncbi:hypothetical protein WR25_26976 [Diploscapter pachys]|uniref:Uncharacterized protein n=1 Tax=Diploscapter pachys TaxID=2018661 RepID=A0A2A2KM29_9BILA|nr:hypothetical protein WR25_26976 [Diploscapter pachys]